MRVPKTFTEWPKDAPIRPASNIVELYEKGFAGALYDPEGKEKFHHDMQWSHGAEAASQFGIAESGAGQLVVPFIHVLKTFPGCWPGAAQERGDCFVAGTLVRMADGSERPIEQVSAGELVISHNGIPQKVTRTIEKDYSGELAVMSVEGYAHTIKATPDHRFVTYGRIGEFECRDWTPIGSLKKGDHVSLPRVAAIERETTFDLADIGSVFTDAGISGRCIRPADGMVRSKGSNLECNRIVKFDERLAWLLGLFLAEGSTDYNHIGQPKRLTFNLNRDEVLLGEQVRQYMFDLFGVVATFANQPSKPNVLLVRVGCRPVAAFFNFLISGNTYTKQVPWQVFSASRAVRLAMLRGWMDGDGHLDLSRRTKGQSKWFRCKLTGVSVNHSLCRGMFDLANSCGLRPTLTRRKPRKQSKAASDLHLYGEQALAVYPDKRSECRTVQMRNRHKLITEHGLAAKVKEVTREPFTGKVYCLEVENDHSFIAEGYAVHNCVSHSNKNGVLVTFACDIVSGKPDEATGKVEGAPDIPAKGVKEGVLSSEYHYWWRGYNGDGWSCSTAANVAVKRGCMLRTAYPDLGIDLTEYSGRLAGTYGSRQPPENILAAGQQHLVRTSTELSSFEEIRDFAFNGYGISSCGSEGFSSTRDENGVSARRGSWAHAMAYIGADDRETTKQKYGGPLVLVLNSWGIWNGGPRRIMGTDIDIPEGSFWARWSDLKRRDCYAFSGFNGWPRKNLPDWGTSKKLG